MSKRVAVALLAVLVLWGPAVAAQNDPPIDMNKARQLFQRERAGEKLTPEEQAYLERAKAERARGRQGQAEQPRPGALAPKESTGLIPLTNKTNEKYKGFTLGLYGDNANEPPVDHLKRATEAAGMVVPLDEKGQPAADGKIALMSVGMSNTTQEFSQFVRTANGDGQKNPRLVIVDAAQGGRAADDWASKDRLQTWQEAEKRLAASGVTSQQIQVLWIKQARKVPSQLGEFPKHAKSLQEDLKNIVLLAKERFPNLRLVYLSSRTYGGWARGNLNPEPYAYESAFSVQWVINDQISGKDTALAYDKAPVLLWGPYLWTDGTKGREQDKLAWEQSDTANDGTHPSNSGRAKVAEQLLGFFKSNATSKGWFVK